ncbi:MAG TPA: ATP-dependent DNA helicase [Candidatus Aquilonibacter sp.]|nr:ATP-dependent DNA helicase [Candidatus Aquilonibacter sp.]
MASQGMAPTEQSAESIPLNPEQRAAVEHGDGPLLVVAGAGTGKTRVIIERIRHLLESDPGLSGENILGLTFTDKAAGEMKHRILKVAGERAKDVCLSTFHSFCIERILQTEDEQIQALDEIDHGILLRRRIAELGLNRFKRLAEPAQFLKDFVKFFSRCQDELVTPDDYQCYVDELRSKYLRQRPSMEDDERAIAEEELAKQDEIARAYRVSERLLRERRLVTFGAQLMQAVERLRSDEGLLERMRAQYKHILVDEFQDTNVAQLELLWLLAGDRRNIVAVGDDDQAIYRFRGASFGSFTIFLERFCGLRGAAAAGAARRFLVSLSRNYRSTQRILRVAGEVIRQNERSSLLPDKNLTTEKAEGDKVRVVEFARPEEEAHWVASEIDRLHDAGAAWKSFAVLYRNHTHREHLLAALRRRRIPFEIRRFSILSSTLVRDLLAYLRVIGNPGDNVACARILAAPYWGLQPRDLVRLTERADRNKRRSLCDEIEAAKDEPPFNREGVRLSELVALLSQMRQAARRLSTRELLDALIERLEVSPLPSDADQQYLERLVEFVKEWERKSEGKKLRDFLEYWNYFQELGGDICLGEESSDDAVQLMTVHAAKGLEFPRVFILRLAKGDFPVRSHEPVFEFPADLMKEEKPRGDFHIQEERRLFYVALTRARQQLTLSTIVNKRKKESPFLEDFLQNPKIQKFDALQSTPRVEVPAIEELAEPAANPTEPARLFGSIPGSAQSTTGAYSRAALWAKAYHPPRPEPLQLSASAINEYTECPMKYQFRRSWGVRGGPHAQMTFGVVMHTTIRDFAEQMHERKRVPLDDVLAAYDREWYSAGFTDDYHEQEYRKEGRRQLEEFHKKYSDAPPDVMCLEKPFELPLENDVVITGRIDQINRISGKGVEIIDYKTGRPKDQKKAEQDFQLSVYALAAKEVLDLEPERLILYNLMTNEPIVTSRDAKALAATKATIADVARQIRAGEFPVKPGFGCRHCDYKPICPAHEQLIPIRPATRQP